MSWLRIPDPRTSAGRQSIDLVLVGASFALVTAISEAIRLTVQKMSGWSAESVAGAWIHAALLLTTTFALAYFLYYTGLRRPPPVKKQVPLRGPRKPHRLSVPASHGRARADSGPVPPSSRR